MNNCIVLVKENVVSDRYTNFWDYGYQISKKFLHVITLSIASCATRFKESIYRICTLCNLLLLNIITLLFSVIEELCCAGACGELAAV